MSSLSFIDFFTACHGHAPLPWQARLAAELCTTHVWPDLIDLPTASGKTACIDIALFHFAHCAAIGEPQKAARRICFVVDRRIIVDAAAERADKLVRKLAEGTHPAIKAVANALLTCGGDAPLECFKLRGGMAKERSFAHCAMQPMLIASTVDQIGSRLLFRGYGVKDYSLSLHAGLLSHDTLILLDEAHLSRAIIATVEALRKQQMQAQESLALQRVRIVPLSATADSTGRRFQLDDQDLANPLLQKRQFCSKPAQLLRCEKQNDRPKVLVQTAVKLVDELKQKIEAPAIAIVVNRVATARAVFEQLQKLKTKSQLELMIGRSRPLDRDLIAKRLIQRCAAGRNQLQEDMPMIVVATQCIEVGADLDFQGMISECAALDALRQRFGRLDRLGNFGNARAVIVGGGESVDDPVYGAALAQTWHWLQTQAHLDFGIQAIAKHLAGVTYSHLNAPVNAELVLTETFVDLLSQTSPRPQYDPDVAALLHGFSDAQEDVRVIWRNSLSGLDADEHELVSEILDQQRPSSLEMLSLSPRACRLWLADSDSNAHVFDIEGVDVDTDEYKLRLDSTKRSPIWRQSHDGFTALRRVDSIRPGDLLVLSDHGGCDAFGFAPSSSAAVADLFQLASKMTRGTRQQVELLTYSILKTMQEAMPDEEHLQALIAIVGAYNDEEISERETNQKLRVVLRELLKRELFADLFETQATALSQVRLLLSSRAKPFGFLLYFGKPKSDDISEDDDSSNMISRKILLSDHNQGVGTRAAQIAQSLRLSAELCADLSLAGHVHDLGKADPRFQRMLRAGLDEHVDSKEILAKGLAKKGARVNLGARHEAYSVALLRANPGLLKHAFDRDLVLHLVGSHHGRGRALQPDVDDSGCRLSVSHQGQNYRFQGAANLGAVADQTAERFQTLQVRYGHHGLAYLEALLRLADHQQSKFEAEAANEGNAP
jgi:CRISPR-associated endonuclease/helicase Cas3